MKKYYTMTIRKADSTVVAYGVLSQNATSPDVDAAIVAINAGLAQAGAGSELLNCNRGQLDIDTTA